MDRIQGGTNRWWSLGLIAIGWFLSFGMRFLLPAILPQIKETFVIDNTSAGLAITIIWAGYGLMQFPAGILVDWLDVRTILGLSLIFAGVSLGVIGFAPVYPVFLVACGLFGLGTGMFGTTRGIALDELFPSRPGRAFGITLAAGSIGSASLPLVANVLIPEIGWRLTVGLSVPLFLGTAAGTYWIVSTAGTSSDESAGRSLEGLLSSLIEALTDTRIVITVAGVTLMLFTFQALTAFLPTYLIEEKSLSQGTASTLFALLFIAGAGFQFTGGSAADHLGTRAVLAGVAILGVGTLATLPFLAGPGPLAALIVVLASRLAVVPVANSFIVATLPDRATGTTWGLLRTGFFLVGSTGSTVVGVFSDHGLFDEAFFALASITAVAAMIFVFLPGGPPGRAARDGT